jgi:hypothetical protein
MYEEVTFSDNFAWRNYGVGLVGSGYSPLSQDSLDVAGAAIPCCVASMAFEAEYECVNFRCGARVPH